MVKVPYAQKVVHAGRAPWSDEKKRKKLATVIVEHFSLKQHRLKKLVAVITGHVSLEKLRLTNAHEAEFAKRAIFGKKLAGIYRQKHFRNVRFK